MRRSKIFAVFSIPLWVLTLSFYSRVVFALEATPVDDPQWRAAHDQQKKFVATHANIPLLFLGDSITAGWLGQGKRVWDRDFKPRKAANFGIGGDKVENVLWRIRNGELPPASQSKVGYVVLLIGTNNLWRDSVDDIVSTIGAILTEVRQTQPDAKVILMALLPRVDEGSVVYRAKLFSVNRQLSQFSRSGAALYLDIGGRYLQPDGTVPEKLMYDGLHLTREGYELFAKELLAVLPSSKK